MAEHDYAEELRIATEATHAAGDEVLRMRREGLRYGHKDGRELAKKQVMKVISFLTSAVKDLRYTDIRVVPTPEGFHVYVPVAHVLGDYLPVTVPWNDIADLMTPQMRTALIG